MAENGKGREFAKGLFQGVGLLSLMMVAVGLLLSVRYRGTLLNAHDTVAAMREDTLLRAVSGFHYWGSAVLIALSACTVAGMAWAGWPKQKPTWWFGALLLLAGAYGSQITGNLLPMDRHDVQTSVVESGVAFRTPLIGELISSQMLQGTSFSQQTLSGWYFVHRWVFPGMAVLGLLMLLAGNMKGKGTGWIALTPSVLAAVLGATVPAASGAAATDADYALRESTVGWYAWPIHGALKAFDAWIGAGWVGSVVVPSLFGLFLVLLPVLWKKWPGWSVRALLLGFLGLFGICGALYAGRPAPLTGDQPVLADTAPKDPKPKDAEPVDLMKAMAGKRLFNDLPCSGCHGKDGVGTPKAPDLRKVFRDHADAKWLKNFIRQPDSVKPGTMMPSFGYLPQEQLDALAEWLRLPK